MTITVVGAGVIGCAIAYEVASRGARVRLIDPRGVADGATRASAGILAPYIEGHGSSLLDLGISSLALYDGFVARVRRDAHSKLEYQRTGTLQVALDAAQDEQLDAAAHLLESTEVDHALLDGDEARALEPSLSRAISAALLIRPQGFVAAQALTQALARAAVTRGAELMTTKVVALNPGGEGVEVVTEAGRVTSDAVVIAAGSWSSFVTKNHQPPTTNLTVMPIRGQLLQLRMPSPPATRVVWGADCYLVPWADGLVLAGATVEDVGFDESSTPEGVEGLRAAAAALIPALEDAPLEQVRVGLRPKTADELPIVGPSSTMRHVFYATGHYRNGVLLAPLTAAMVADLVLDGVQRPELALVSPARVGL